MSHHLVHVSVISPMIAMASISSLAPCKPTEWESFNTALIQIQERATRVRACNYIEIETGRNFLPVLKIVTHCTGCVNVNVAMRARDQCSIFSRVQ